MVECDQLDAAKVLGDRMHRPQRLELGQRAGNECRQSAIGRAWWKSLPVDAWREIVSSRAQIDAHAARGCRLRRSGGGLLHRHQHGLLPKRFPDRLRLRSRCHSRR